jgi:hypothetical protein
MAGKEHLVVYAASYETVDAARSEGFEPQPSDP